MVLDVGTNNPDLLNDPMYMGWRHERVSGAQYEEFVDLFIQAIKRRWPNVLLQFEDFAQTNAMPLLERYKDELCCFNDDIQGTAAVAVGTLLAACKAKGEKLSEQTVTFVGAGSAGCGIAEQIIAAMQLEGLDEAQARRRIFMVDRWGCSPTTRATCSTSSTTGAEARRSRCLGRPAGRRPGVAGSDPQCPADGADRRLRAAGCFPKRSSVSCTAIASSRW